MSVRQRKEAIKEMDNNFQYESSTALKTGQIWLLTSTSKKNAQRKRKYVVKDPVQ